MFFKKRSKNINIEAISHHWSNFHYRYYEFRIWQTSNIWIDVARVKRRSIPFDEISLDSLSDDDSLHELIRNLLQSVRY